MINPKLLEIFGKESRALFAGIVAAIGEGSANKYYVIPNTVIEENGVKRPRYMSSTDSNVKQVQSTIYDFVFNFTGNDDATGILIYNREHEECEVPLWVN